MNIRFTPSPPFGRPSQVVLPFPQREAVSSASERVHFWTQLQTYAEKKRRQIAEAFRSDHTQEEENNTTLLAFPTLIRVAIGEDMPPEAA
jgi:hypothetical protein